MKQDDQPLIDYYRILQVDPNCDAKALELAYLHLAKIYHPDHPETADVSKFSAVVEAYKVLRHPEQRAAYDVLFGEYTGFVFTVGPEGEEEASAVISDAQAHHRILMFLYKRRRDNAQDAGVGRYFVQQLLKCTDESFNFHLWYLKSKGFIETTEQGTLAITIEGVDHVIAESRTAAKEQLRIMQARGGETAPDAA